MKKTRRRFLGSAAATAGVLFCGCSLLETARAQGPARKRQPVMIRGKRIKTIDVHAHCAFAEALPLIGGNRDLMLPNPKVRGVGESFIDVKQRFAAMDEQCVDMEVLSVNPFWYGLAGDKAAEIVRINNEKMAELCAAHPDRFAGFASLTLQEPDLAVRELEIAIKVQGLKGAAIGDAVEGVELADPRFNPVWAKAEALGAVLFIHPLPIPELNERLAGNGWLHNTISNPLATTIALSHLIFEGSFDRFPTLEVVAAHGGGYLPSYADRSDHACLVAPANCNPDIHLGKKPAEYLKQIYFDSLVFSSEALRHLIAQVGAGQVVLGSDYPYPWQMAPVDHILDCDFLNDDQKRAVLSGTLARLLNVDASGTVSP